LTWILANGFVCKAGVEDGGTISSVLAIGSTFFSGGLLFTYVNLVPKLVKLVKLESTSD
jgi:hypothetical protein